MAQSLLAVPTPPEVKNARLVRGLGDGPEEKINHSAKAKQAKTPRLTSAQEYAIQFEFRQHMQKLARALSKVRRSNADSRKAKLVELAAKFGVSPTAIRVCVGQK